MVTFVYDIAIIRHGNVIIQHSIWKVSCQKGPTSHAYAWQIWPFWQDTLDIAKLSVVRI